MTVIRRQELLEQIKAVHNDVRTAASASPSAPGTAVVEAGGAGSEQFSTLRVRVDFIGEKMEEQTRVLEKVNARLEGSAAAAHTAEGSAAESAARLLGKLETVDSVLGSKTSTLEAHMAHLNEKVVELSKQTHATAEHVRTETAAIKQLMEAMSSSRSSVLFPLAVCGQALIVAALLFYASATANGKRRSHLP